MRPVSTFEPLGEAEVGDLGAAVGREQDVGRFQVAMDDPQPVHLVDRPGERLDQPGRVPWRPRLAAQAAGQAAAGDVFHLEIRPALVLAEGEDLDDVRVVQPRDGLGLGEEPDGRLGGRMVAGQDRLERDDPVEPELASPVDHPHAAAAQLLEDLVPGHDRPGHRGANGQVADGQRRILVRCHPGARAGSPPRPRTGA